MIIAPEARITRVSPSLSGDRICSTFPRTALTSPNTGRRPGRGGSGLGDSGLALEVWALGVGDWGLGSAASSGHRTPKTRANPRLSTAVVLVRFHAAPSPPARGPAPQ